MTWRKRRKMKGRLTWKSEEKSSGDMRGTRRKKEVRKRFEMKRRNIGGRGRKRESATRRKVKWRKKM